MSWAETMFLKKIIKGQKRFVTSDAIILDIQGSADVIRTKDFMFSGTFVPKLDGTLFFSFQGTIEYFPETYLRVYEDGELIKSLFVDGDSETQGGTIAFNVSANHSYTFGIRNDSSYNMVIDYAHICGQVVDAYWFTYNTESE